MLMNEHLNEFLSKLIIFLNRIVNLYMYYVAVACVLSWIPRINPEYPLFHVIFVSTGFYLLPPFGGFIFAPLIIMTVCVLISQGLGRLYFNLNKDKKPEVIVMTPEEFFRSIEQGRLKLQNEETVKDKNPDNEKSGDTVLSEDTHKVTQKEEYITEKTNEEKEDNNDV